MYFKNPPACWSGVKNGIAPSILKDECAMPAGCFLWHFVSGWVGKCWHACCTSVSTGGSCPLRCCEFRVRNGTCSRTPVFCFVIIPTLVICPTRQHIDAQENQERSWSLLRLGADFLDVNGYQLSFSQEGVQNQLSGVWSQHPRARWSRAQQVRWKTSPAVSWEGAQTNGPTEDWSFSILTVHLLGGIQRERERERETDRQIDRSIDR